MAFRIFQKYAVLNGLNLSELGIITRYGYEVAYHPVDGGQGDLTQDGTYQEDEIALKAVISFPIMPLPEDVMGQLLRTVYDSERPQLIYFDIKKGDYRNIYTRRGKMTAAKYRGRGADGKDYWTTGSLVLTEK